MNFPELNDKTPIHALHYANDWELFEHCVRYAVLNNIDLEPKQHNVWANILFGKFVGDFNNRQNYMSRVKQAYNIYFTGFDADSDDDGTLYSFEVDKIVKHFPFLFANYIPHEKDLFAEIKEALENEYDESREYRHAEIYKVSQLDVVKIKNNTRVYLLTLEISDDIYPHFREGLRILVKVDADTYYTCEIVDYDYENGILSVTCENEIIYTAFSKIRVVVNNSFIIAGLQERLTDIQNVIQNKSYPLNKFLKNCTRQISKVLHSTILPQWIYDRVNNDFSQFEALNAALDNDITFIWGPPGTGKSYTLATIIRALYEIPDERTVVCCLSNVAVDQLLNKVIDILDEEEKQPECGNFYRAGHSMDQRVLGTAYLFPDDEKTNYYREEIISRNAILEKMDKESEEDMVKSVIIKAEIKDLRKALREHTDYLVKKSRVVFSTIDNFVLSKTINNCDFDNLVVDEASMLSMPKLIALATKVAKRIILVGDFQQLSPIALVPDKWLQANVFELAGIDINHLDHPGLKRLLKQRRSYEDIVNLVNDTFYQGKLETEIDLLPEVTKLAPFKRRPISLVNYVDGELNFTRGGTRQNFPNAYLLMDLLEEYYETGHDEHSVGIITPYVGQSNLYRKLISLRQYPKAFADNIQVGTIHTFQGSECDIIFLDLVDCEKKLKGKAANIGKIYQGLEGERLLNVAVSRARYKLIVVGDAAYFDRAPGNKISNKTLKMLQNLRRFTVKYPYE